MSKSKGAPLPDLDDDELVRRLQPLAESVLPPGQGRGRGAPPAEAPVASPPKPAAAAPVAKPPRTGIEFLLPEAVVTDIKTRALQRGVTATVLLLEVLRDAGYPVTDADFTDLRKLPRR
jgi:hypothetical protein